MDRIMAALDPSHPEAAEQVRSDLKLLVPYCHWTSGTWESLGMRWNEIQNVPRHTHELSSFIIRTYLQTRVASR
jgi:hypothetical protein